MLISQGLNPETEDLATFVEHFERADTTDNIAMAKFSASDEDSDTKKNKKCYKKFPEREGNSKKRRNNSSGYCSLHGGKKSNLKRGKISQVKGFILIQS